MAGLCDGVGDDQGLGDDAASVADFDVLGVEPEVRVGALEWTLAELLDVLIELATQAADAVLAHALDAELLDEPVDLPGRDAVDVGLHHDRHDRLLTAPPRLQERRKVGRARPGPGDRQVDLADPRLPGPLAVPVEVCHPPVGALPPGGASELGDFGFHQLAHDHRDRVAQHVSLLAGHRLRDDISRGHHPVLGHRGAPSHRSSGEADELGHHGGRTQRRDRLVPPTPLLPT